MHTFVAHNVLLMHMRFIVLQVYELGYIFQHFKFMAKDKISRVIEQLDEVIGEVAASEVVAINCVADVVALEDGHSVGHSVSRVQHDPGGLA